MACGPRVVKASALASLMYYVGAATLKRELVWQNECAFWQDVVEKAPKPRAINNYAVALWHQGEIDQAVNYFKKAIETDHWYAEPHANLGTIYQVKGDEENALYHYARAVEIDDGHAQLFNNLGQLHVSRGAHEAAELCFKRSIALHATTPNAYLNLAQLYEKQKRDQEALDTYQHACARQLTTPALLYAYGSLAYRMDKLPQAIGAFELLDQGYEQTAYLLGCCYYDQQHYEQAVKNLALASKKDPLNIKYLYHYAQALMHAKHYDEAAAMYSLCMTNDQVFAPASLQKIYCLYSAGHKQLAQQQMASFLEHDLQPHVVEKAVALRQKYLT
jgi:tetratricopeptide (TPR) repeat protein